MNWMWMLIFGCWYQGSSHCHSSRCSIKIHPRKRSNKKTKHIKCLLHWIMPNVWLLICVVANKDSLKKSFKQWIFLTQYTLYVWTIDRSSSVLLLTIFPNYIPPLCAYVTLWKLHSKSMFAILLLSRWLRPIDFMQWIRCRKDHFSYTQFNEYIYKFTLCRTFYQYRKRFYMELRFI